MSGVKITLYILSLICFTTIVLPFIKKDHWVFRIFDYPRLQKFVLVGFTGTLWLIICRDDCNTFEYGIVAALFATFLHLGYLIIPYTPLGKKMIRRADDRTGETLDLLVCNVYQKNRNFKGLVSLIKKRDADIVFLLETNKEWLDNIDEIRKDYPHSIEIPMENTYGLLFYSRLPIKNREINYLLDDEIPSIIADVDFNGRTVRIYGLHPTPPVPQENEHSTDRDAEILIIGKLAKKYEGPCLVIGDLNDVAWSYTTRLFLKVSGLLDPRRGRGLYSTFHAKYWLLRWPLDHFFVSGHFRLASIKVEEPVGSDHFPISISLVLTAEDNSRALDPDAEDKKLAEKKIDAGLSKDPL